MNILSLLEKHIQEIVETKWADDTCPPRFLVSVLGYGEEQKIVLLVSHNGYCYSKVIFPIPGVNYSYNSIEQEMEWLYNRTM